MLFLEKMFDFSIIINCWAMESDFNKKSELQEDA